MVATPKPRPGPTRQGPVGAQRGVRALEHAVGGVVAELPERPAQGPPQGFVAAGGHQAVELSLIEPQPYERIGGRRQLLDGPGALPDYDDQLLAGAGVAIAGAEQFRGSRSRRHPEGHQRPVAMRAQLSEQVVEALVGDAARQPLHDPGPIQPRAFLAKGVHRIVMRVRAASWPDEGERVDHRARARVAVEVVEATQHALAVAAGGSRALGARLGLARHRVRRGRHCSAGLRGLVGDLDPAREVAGLGPRGLIPRHVDRPQKPEPAQQVHPVRALRRRRPTDRLQIAQVHRDRPTISPAGSTSR